jgi:hypothetical protein
MENVTKVEPRLLSSGDDERCGRGAKRTTRQMTRLATSDVSETLSGNVPERPGKC